jgi:hypothetical protein
MREIFKAIHESSEASHETGNEIFGASKLLTVFLLIPKILYF